MEGLVQANTKLIAPRSMGMVYLYIDRADERPHPSELKAEADRLFVTDCGASRNISIAQFIMSATGGSNCGTRPLALPEGSRRAAVQTG